MEHIKVSMKDLKKKVSKDIFGMSFEEAIKQNICVHCREDVDGEGKIYSEAGRREYKISGLCELCFDKITTPKD